MGKRKVANASTASQDSKKTKTEPVETTRILRSSSKNKAALQPTTAPIAANKTTNTYTDAELESRVLKLLLLTPTSSLAPLEKYCKAYLHHEPTTFAASLFTFLIKHKHAIPEQAYTQIASLLVLNQSDDLSHDSLQLICHKLTDSALKNRHFCFHNPLFRLLADLLPNISAGSSAILNSMFEQILAKGQLSAESLLHLGQYFVGFKTKNSSQTCGTFVQKLYTDAQKMAPQLLVRLIKLSFQLASCLNDADPNRVAIYTKVLGLFMDINYVSIDYIAHKLFFSQAEQEAMEQFKGDSKFHKFAPQIKHFLSEYTLGKTMNRAFFAFNLTALNCGADLSGAFVSTIVSYLRALVFKADSTWAQSSLKDKLNVNTLNRMVKYHNLILVLSEDDLALGLVKFCVLLLNECNDDDENGDDKLNKLIVGFCANVLSDLIHNCPRAKLTVLDLFLSRILEVKRSPRLFIDQIERLFTQWSLKDFYLSDATSRHECMVVVLRKLTNLGPGDSASRIVTSFDTTANRLIHLRPDDAVSLLKALRLFIFTNDVGVRNGLHLNEMLARYLLCGIEDCVSDKMSVAIHGLVSLMCFQSKFSIVKSKNSKSKLTDTDLAKISQYQTNAAFRIKTIFKCLTYSVKYESLDVKYKSHILQSLQLLVSHDTLLVKEITLFLTNRIKKFIVIDTERNQRYFNLEKCLVQEGQLKLVEPVDVLLNVAILCYSKGLETIRNRSLHEAFGSLVALKHLVKLLVKTYLEMEARTIFDIYSKQLQLSSRPVASLDIVQQTQFGIMDSIMEYLIISESYSDLSVILNKYDATSKLISNHIEDYIRQERRGLSATKRKLCFDVSSVSSNASKRLRSSNKENHENSVNVNATKAATSKRTPFSNLANIALPTEQPLANTSQFKPSQAFTNIEFEFTPTISFKSCLKLVHLQFCSKEPVALTSTPNKTLVELLINPKLLDYTLKVCEKKLDGLKSRQKNSIYDPELLNQAELHAVLADLWFGFTTRITGLSSGILAKKDADTLSSRFKPEFLANNNKMTQLCSILWELSSDQLLPTQPSTWQLLQSLASTTKLYSNCDTKNTKAFTLCTSLLKLMLQIVESSHLLTADNYKSFEEWLIELAKKPQSDQSDIGEMIVRLLLGIAARTESPITTLKSIAFEQSVINLQPICTCVSSDSSIYTYQTKSLKIISMTEQFRFLTPTNSLQIHVITHESLISWLRAVQWAIAENFNLFEADCLIESVCKQLEVAILALSYLLKSVTNINASNLVLQSISTFYEVMFELIQSDLLQSCADSDSLHRVKSLVNSIYASFNCKKITVDLNRIKMLRESNLSLCDFLDGMLEIKDTFYECLERIDGFERCLQAFSQTSNLVRDVKILENYKTFIRSLELNPDEIGNVQAVTRSFMAGV
jgi:hypothetical protein